MYVVVTEFGNIRCDSVVKNGNFLICDGVEVGEEKTDDKGEKFLIWKKSEAISILESRIIYIQGSATSIKKYTEREESETDGNELTESQLQALNEYEKRQNKKSLFGRK